MPAPRGFCSLGLLFGVESDGCVNCVGGSGMIGGLVYHSCDVTVTICYRYAMLRVVTRVHIFLHFFPFIVAVVKSIATYGRYNWPI
jgi:hypothetical protein